MNILIVDDDRAFLELAKRKLNVLGVMVHLCGSGNEAIEFLKKEKSIVDLILLDHLMPGKDGLETFREIRSQGIHAPAIMLTGHSTLSLVVAFLKEGGSDFVEKPVDFAVLEVKIRQVLETNGVLNGKKRLIETVESVSKTMDVIKGLTASMENDLRQLAKSGASPDCAARVEKTISDINNSIKQAETAISLSRRRL